MLPPPRTYKVRSGDTIYGVSRLFNVSTTQIARLNTLRAPFVLQRGQVIRLPAVAEQPSRPVMQVASLSAPEVIREGVTSDEIVKLIEEDADIGILVLAAGTGKEGPGPLVSNVAKAAGTFPIPVAIVPGHLSDDDIDASS